MLTASIRTGKRRITMFAAALVVGSAAFTGVVAAPASANTAAPAAAVKQADPVEVQSHDTYGNCNWVNDFDRPTISFGNRSNYVRQIQCLINQGSKFPETLVADGIFGPATLRGVRWVQSCNGTVGGADGIVGPSTWHRLYEPLLRCALDH